MIVDQPLWVRHPAPDASGSRPKPAASGTAAMNGKVSLARAAVGQLPSPAPVEEEGQDEEDAQLPRAAIYSVDIHPDGERFATGGADNTCRVWSTEGLDLDLDDDEKENGAAPGGTPLLNGKGKGNDNGNSQGMKLKAKKKKKKKKGARLVAILAKHQGEVNAVRWSPTGSLLASGSADTQVLLFRKRANGSGSGGVSRVDAANLSVVLPSSWSTHQLVNSFTRSSSAPNPISRSPYLPL